MASINYTVVINILVITTSVLGLISAEQLSLRNTICHVCFVLEFDVNIVIVFQDDHLVTENFPIKLTRF